MAKQTGFNTDDLALFWEAIENMFEHDRSAARGLMGMRKIFIFEHSSEMGNCPVQQLFDAIEISSTKSPPRDFSDYLISVKTDTIPENVTLIEK